MHEHSAGRATLAVLGAGPKGLAIAAKRAALARTGRDVPDLLLVDREGVAANWSGAAGYTDSRQRLSTLDCDGLVVTGPGKPIRLPGQPDDHPRILDGRTFWTSEDVLARGGPVTVAGRVSRLEPVEAKVIVEVDYEEERERIAFDWVVVAVGFDPLWFSHLLGGRARRARRMPSRTSLERAIGYDLAVAGLHPWLHLPVLVGVAQGPGFPNLSCLGLLADRVLGAYAAPWAGASRPATDQAAAPGRAR
jgi:hypothetical protein